MQQFDCFDDESHIRQIASRGEVRLVHQLETEIYERVPNHTDRPIPIPNRSFHDDLAEFLQVGDKRLDRFNVVDVFRVDENGDVGFLVQG